MDGDPDGIELLLATARQEITTLLADPRFSKSDGKRGGALYQHVRDLIDAVEHRITQRPDEAAPVAVAESFSRSLRESIIVLRAAHAAMPWLAATRSPRVNLGSLYMTEESAEIIVGPSVDLVVLPDTEFMYSTISWPFAKVINNTSGFKPKTSRRPIILNYPLRDSERLLLHGLFAHELGHSSVDECQSVSAVEKALDDDDEFAIALKDTVATMGRKWAAASESKITGTLRGWLRSWIEELLCDHLAIAANGPAYLWAFVGFVLPLSYSAPGPGYPPNTLRVRLMLDFLKRVGWDRYQASIAPAVQDWLDTVGADAVTASESPYDFLVTQLLRRQDLLQQVATDALGSYVLKPKNAERQANEAAELLDRLILPVGSPSPFMARAILLAGWQEGFRRYGGTTDGLVAALGDQALQELVGKAIEMGTVTTQWDNG